MAAERINEEMLLPSRPTLKMPMGDLSLLKVTRDMVAPDERALEEFRNEFSIVLQIVLKHCNSGTRAKLALNAGIQTAVMNNDVVHYLYELKLACIRGGDTGMAKLKDYEDALLKPMMYGTGMEALYGGGESAFAKYADAFKNGLTSCRACGSVRTDSEFIQGFVSGLHMQFDSTKVEIMKHTTIDSAIEYALGCLRSGIVLCIKGWESSPPTSKVGVKRSFTMAEMNHNQKNATLPVSTNFNPSASSSHPTVRTASLKHPYRNHSPYRDSNSNSTVRGNDSTFSSSSAGGGRSSATKQVFAIRLDDSPDDIELTLTEDDLNMISREHLLAAEKRGEERMCNIFQLNVAGTRAICHEWYVKGECSKKSHKSGDVFLKCFYDHPEIGPNFKPLIAKSNK
jgi:hypothetical protein